MKEIKEKMLELSESFEWLKSTVELLNLLEGVGDSWARVAIATGAVRDWLDKSFGEGIGESVSKEAEGNAILYFRALWTKPDESLVRRMGAVRWSLSAEGISDLRRFWGVHPSEVSTDELAAFMATLPDGSASAVAYSEYQAPMSVLAQAMAVDRITMLLQQNAGKSGKLPDEKSLLAMLKKKDNSEKQRFDYLAEKERERRRQEKSQDAV